jgi:hypothetical protein
MTDKSIHAVVPLAFDEAMQDKYFERIESELTAVAPRSKFMRSARVAISAARDLTTGTDASVVGASLVVFDERLSEDDRLDALDCQMFAEAVVRRLPKETSNEQRYVQYNDALLAVGWVSEGFTHKKYVSEQLTLTMNEAVLQVLETVIAGSAGNVLSLVASGFSKLKGDKDALKIVDIGSKHNEAVSFKAVPCIVAPGGGMAMLLGGLDLVDKDFDGNFLFVTYKTEGIQLFQAAGVRKFNRRAFERKKAMMYTYIDQFGDDLFKKLTEQ